MRRNVVRGREDALCRTLLGAAGLLALLAGLSACTRPSSATSSTSGVWVEVSPGTTRPGSRVTVRADCVDTKNPATVTSSAFGTLTLQPFHTRLLAEVQVSASATEGQHEVTLTCHSGATATATLFVVSGKAPPPTAGPHTGGGFLASDEGVLSGPAVWLAGGSGALIAAAVVGVASVRRRRRAPVR